MALGDYFQNKSDPKEGEILSIAKEICSVFIKIEKQNASFLNSFSDFSLTLRQKTKSNNSYKLFIVPKPWKSNDNKKKLYDKTSEEGLLIQLGEKILNLYHPGFNSFSKS